MCGRDGLKDLSPLLSGIFHPSGFKFSLKKRAGQGVKHAGEVYKGPLVPIIAKCLFDCLH